jgi:cyanophycinase
MKIKILLIVICAWFSFLSNINAQGSVCAVGGGSEDVNSWSDIPYSWIVDKADSGKIVVLSYSSASQWLPNYFRRFGAESAINYEIGSRTVADLQSTYDEIVSAQGVFIKGGDQSRYVEYWKGTKTEDAIRQVYNNGGVIAGTSAGAMVLGEIVFTAEKTSVQPRSALINPFSSQITLDDDFLGLTPNVLFDTHFIERGRVGRLIPFMINYLNLTDRKIIGVGIDDRTAICIDQSGMGYVYGSGAVSIMQFDGLTNFVKEDNKYTLENLRVDKLLHGWSFNFNDLQINEYSPRTRNTNFDPLPVYPSNDIFITGDDNLNSNFGNPVTEFISEVNYTKLAFIYDSGYSAGFEAIRPSIVNASIEFEAFSITEQLLSSNEESQKLNECDAIILFGDDLSSIVKLADQSYTFSSTLQGIISNNAPLMFLGTSSKIVSKLLSVNNEEDELASYYGELEFENGLNLFSNVALQPKVFKQSDYFENNVSSIQYAMMLGNQSYGLLIDHGELIKFDSQSNTLEYSGKYPVFVIDASNSTVVDSSIYKAGSNSGTRQVIGIDNLRATVSTLAESFDLGEGKNCFC